MKKYLFIAFGALFSFAQASNDFGDLQIKDVKKVGHFDGYDAKGQFIGVNAYEGSVLLRTSKIPVGFHVMTGVGEDYKIPKISHVYVGHTDGNGFTPKNLDKNDQNEILKDFENLDSFKKDIEKSALNSIKH